MEIRKISINDVNPAEYNPRVDLCPGDAEYEKLKKSLETFGCVEPLVWNEKTGNLVGGHQRFKVLVEQGLKEVEVSVVKLSGAQEKALNLALNKIQGDWDNDKLASLLAELEQIPDFDMELTGFEALEISKLFDSYLAGDEEDSYEIGQKDMPITQKGDIIELGKHCILCGDSADYKDVEKLLQKRKAELVVMDPPYNVSYDDGQRPTGKSGDSKWEPIESDSMPQKEYEAWLKLVLSNMGRVVAQGAPAYIWNGHRQFGPMHLMLNELGFHVGCVITWVKERFAIGYADYNQQSEFCLYGWKEDNGAHKWYGPANESTVWENSRDSIGSLIHPTQKPIALAERSIKNSSKRGDIVLDMFLGSGSTLIAAEKLNRTCYGLEISPLYCDAIIRRYIRYVGKEKISSQILEKYMKEETHA